MKKVFIITGEYSGDKHASGVVRELKKICPDVVIEGVGESNLEKEGVKLFRNHENMGKMGLTPKTIYQHLVLGLDIVKYNPERGLNWFISHSTNFHSFNGFGRDEIGKEYQIKIDLLLTFKETYEEYRDYQLKKVEEKFSNRIKTEDILK